MKKIIWLLSFFSILSINSYSQGSFNWITPNKTYIKCYVNTDGIQRIRKIDFENAGINTSSIDPRTVKVLYKGNQIPVFFQGEDNAVFDENDYLDFYAKRNSGGITPHYHGFTNANLYNTNEYYDLYSDTSVYWIDWGGENGLRMNKSTFISSVNYPANSFYSKMHFEKDTYYYLGETLNPNNDFKYFSTEIVAGEGWFWRALSTNESIEESFLLNDVSQTTQLCSLKLFVYPRSYTNSVLNEHQLIISINNSIIDTLRRDNLVRFDTIVVFQSSLLNNNAQNTINIRYLPLNNDLFTPVVDVDYFELSYPREFRIRNNGLTVNLTGADSTSKKISVSGYNNSNQINIYDIRNNIRIEGFTASSDIITFTGKGNSGFEISNENITRKPFRIISRQVPNLAAVSNRADYLIVYNKMFESQAEQLRVHRETFNEYRSVKAEIQDIYDIFNYGIESPVAVRNFVKYAYENWQTPRLQYLCLFGRASLDPKKSSPGSQYYSNFIPTYGNPPTDGYFVNFNIGTFTYYHQISAGRIPSYTTTEAQNAIDKIIAYDYQLPEKWWKRFIFITGGPDRNQQISFQIKSNNLVNNYILPKPVTGSVTKIYRNDSLGFITYNYKDSIKKEFDKGASIVNFIGHAAAQDWEIGLEDPNTLNNGSRLPLVLSFTCYTGRNAETNIRSFGENFMLLPNKGSVSFIGTTGWSFSGSGDLYNELIFDQFAKRSQRSIGEIVRIVTDSLSSDSLIFAFRNTINCYNLIGDPATRIIMPVNPEFDIKQNDYTLSNPFPALGEEIRLTVFPKNLGTAADSVKIRFNLKKNGTIVQSKDTLIRNFNYIDTLNHFFKIDSSGNYNMTIVADPERWYQQEFTNNDSVTFLLTLRNLSYIQIKPLNNAVLNSTEFKFTGLNPNTDFGSNSVKIILQVDTSRNFNSSVSQTYINNNPGGVTSGFNVSIPVQNINTVYYLRTNAVIDNDSSGWSDASKIIYNPGITGKDAVSDSVFTLYTLKPGQYKQSDIVNLKYTENGYVLDQFTGNLFIRSYGSNGDQASYFTINSINFYSDGGSNTGLNIAKVKKLTGKAAAIKNFRMTSAQSSDSVLNFLNTFDNTDYIMAYNASYVDVAIADSLRPDAIAKFGQFGSRFIDSVKLGWFDTWAFFGFLGADSNQTCENFHVFYSNFNWEISDCQMFPVFQQTSGSISQNIGIAEKWKNFSWDQILNPNSSVKFDVYGINSDNESTSLYSGLANNSSVNLDTINAFLYPNLRLTARLEIDTISGLESPVYQSTNFKYIPPAELVPDNNSFTGSDTSVQEGDSVRFSVKFFNMGYKNVQNCINKWYIKNQGEIMILKTDTLFSTLEIDSFKISEVKFGTAGLRNPKISRDTIQLYFETSMPANENELFTFNNTSVTRFIVEGDSINPDMEITYDGVKINNGDFVQANPEIKLQFFDNSNMVVSDTSNVKIYKFSEQSQRFMYVPYYINGQPNPVLRIEFPDNSFLQATVYYTPQLTSGTHKFNFVALDNSGNFADSVQNTVLVNNSMKIYDMANYPNPMKTETSFMFSLSGEINPVSCKVKIYTVGGKLIKEINYPAAVGYNQIPWDGKDDDGDYMANGTYLYKFVIQGNSSVETSVQKLVILR